MEEQKSDSFAPIEWESVEFEVYRKDWRWYSVAAVIVVLLLAYVVYAKQWLFGIVVLVLMATIFIVGRVKPKSLHCRIDVTGITINDRTFPYDQLKMFWFHQVEDKFYLNLLSTSRTIPTISLAIPQDYQTKLRTTLSRFLPESDTRKNDFIDRLGRILKI